MDDNDNDRDRMILPRRASRPAGIVRRSLLPFHGPRADAYCATWNEEPQMIFRPRGLLLWDIPDRSVVELIQIGLQPQLVASVGPIPARWFTTADSYDQVWKLHQEGKDPPGWGDWQVIAIGMRLQIRMSAPNVDPELWSRVQLLMWGESIQ